MLSPEQLQAVTQLTGQLDARQLAWLSGYLAGQQEQRPLTALAEPPRADETPRATVLYGSQTGNSRSAAEALATAIRARGLEADIFPMSDYKTARLKKEKFLFAVISTHGEGEPPDAAAMFYEFLHSSRAPKLTAAYSVLALGDSSYEHFCQSGRDMDVRLRALGATPLAELTECDLDFEREAGQWRASVVEALVRESRPAAPLITMPVAVTAAYNRQNPFAAPVLLNLPLNYRQRTTRHLELSLEGAGLSHRPGDALGIWPQNSRALAEQAAAALQIDWQEELDIDGERATVGEWLLSQLDINFLTPAVLERYRNIVGEALAAVCAERAVARRYAHGRNICDLLAEYPPPAGMAAAVLACLRRLTPRLYSLASSAFAREDEAHLLVGRDSYTDAHGRMREGVCSAYLSQMGEGETINVFVQSNDNFRLPDDNAAPIIMIGPGTGVAPFRAFMEEREERGGGGKNWLFFGERRRREDFYYQTEWQARQRTGLLTRLDAAFSRDGANKVYVQHKMHHYGKALWEWLADGAYVYVCGDESRMAGDVHAELAQIVQAHGGRDGESYLKTMRETGRYQRDVY